MVYPWTGPLLQNGAVPMRFGIDAGHSKVGAGMVIHIVGTLAQRPVLLLTTLCSAESKEYVKLSLIFLLDTLPYLKERKKIFVADMGLVLLVSNLSFFSFYGLNLCRVSNSVFLLSSLTKI